MKHAATTMAVAVILGAGCGGSGPDITGGWSMDINSSCGMVINFDRSAGGYAYQIVCQTGPNSYGSELEAGDANFSVAGKVTTTARRTSCAASDHSSETMSYSFSGERLILTADQGVLALDPIKGEAGTSAAIAFGCWSMGSFDPHPIQPL